MAGFGTTGTSGAATTVGFGSTMGGTLRAVESDALMESSFRRLLASIDGERDQQRSAWQRLQQESDNTRDELERIRQETEDWCYSENQKIKGEWDRLNKLSEDMAKLWPQELDVIQINCAGEIFTLPKENLCSIPGSVLAEMFSDDFIEEIPRDEIGRFYLDFNPQCFGIVVEYLRNRRLRADAPLPIIPAVQQRNMEILAEAWKLRPFMKQNRMNPMHGTSLNISKRSASAALALPSDSASGISGGEEGEVFEVVSATHPGWQVISAESALPVSSPSYFEVSILANPDSRGGLAIGVCNHIPQGTEIHSIRLQCCVLYNSNNGVLGDVLGEHDVQPKLELKEGETIGIRHDVASKTLQWFHNRVYIGTSTFKQESLEHLATIYPVFGLYVPDQAISVDFRAAAPEFPGQVRG